MEVNMLKNVGHTDKIVRIVLGTLVLVYAFFGHISLLGTILLIIAGVVLIHTGYKQHCMGYEMLGVNTCGECCGMEKCDMDMKKDHKHKSVAKKVTKKTSKKKKKK